MAVTYDRKIKEADAPSQDECQLQVQRILRSGSFRNASMLQQLLQYLATKSYAPGAESLKEYTIGVEAFSRTHDFDPKTDTIVRVQIHRLRQKLKEYYDTDGINDPVQVDIPKGHYLPIFGVMETPVLGIAPNHGSAFSNGNGAETNGPERKDGRSAKPSMVYALVAALALVVFGIGFWVGNLRPRSAAASQTVSRFGETNFDKSPDPVKAFWISFLGNDPAPVIAYPDEVFLLDNFNDLFRFRRGATDYRGAPVDPHVAQEFASNPALVARAGQLYYENSYLGFGELKAVGMLSNLFGQMGLRPVIKASRELTVDDLKQHNVIILGSSFSNIAEAHFTTMGDFSFKNPDSRLEQWRGIIVNAHPRANEEASYGTERDPSTQVLRADYSLITIQPGIVPGRYIIDLGGLDTTGSEGAALFATSRQGVDDLSRALSSSTKTPAKNGFPTFQALLRVRLEKGYDVLGASLVTVHMLPQTAPEAGSSAPAQAPNP